MYSKHSRRLIEDQSAFENADGGCGVIGFPHHLFTSIEERFKLTRNHQSEEMEQDVVGQYIHIEIEARATTAGLPFIHEARVEFVPNKHRDSGDFIPWRAVWRLGLNLNRDFEPWSL